MIVEVVKIRLNQTPGKIENIAEENAAIDFLYRIYYILGVVVLIIKIRETK